MSVENLFHLVLIHTADWKSFFAISIISLLKDSILFKEMIKIDGFEEIVFRQCLFKEEIDCLVIMVLPGVITLYNL